MALNRKLLRTFCVGATLVAANALAQSANRLVDPLAPEGVVIRPGTVEVVRDDQSSRTDFQSEQFATAIAQQRSQGWIDVDEYKAATVDRAFELPSATGLSAPTIDSLLSSLRIAPAVLQGTILEDASLDGAGTAGGYVEGGWSGLVRRFVVPQLGRLVLEEYDYVVAGSHFRIPEAAVDSYINGLPMTYRVFRSQSGNGYSEFVWFSGTKHFRLMVEGEISRSSQAYTSIEHLMR